MAFIQEVLFLRTYQHGSLGSTSIARSVSRLKKASLSLPLFWKRLMVSLSDQGWILSRPSLFAARRSC